MKINYVLITAARNEETYIEKTIKAVLSQGLLPKQWVIVSDASEDRTDEIVKEVASKKEFIYFIRKEKKPGEIGFASKVNALQLGYGNLAKVPYDFIGHLDADVSFGAEYYQCIIEKALNKPSLGITGGFIYERTGTGFRSRPSNTGESVAGAIQFFRRKCYEDIGQFIPIPVGGEDWYAEIVARMKGWEVKSYPELKVFHHKKGVRTRGLIKENFRQGMVDFCFGTHPLFEIAKVARRVKEKPYFFAALVRLAGFLWSYPSRLERVVPREIIEYLRREQLARLRAKLCL